MNIFKDQNEFRSFLTQTVKDAIGNDLNEGQKKQVEDLVKAHVPGTPVEVKLNIVKDEKPAEVKKEEAAVVDQNTDVKAILEQMKKENKELSEAFQAFKDGKVREETSDTKTKKTEENVDTDNRPQGLWDALAGELNNAMSSRRKNF